jgi:hypothetical protein
MLSKDFPETEPLDKLNMSRLAQQPEKIRELLKEHAESEEKTKALTLRKLGPGLKITIWLLRIYVIFMAVVVVINVIQTVHGS